MCDSISRKTLFDLIAVLNTSFSDYDFSDTKSESFSFVASAEVFFWMQIFNIWILQDMVHSVDAKLNTVVAAYNNKLRARLWRAINDEIKISECKIYRY